MLKMFLRCLLALSLAIFFLFSCAEATSSLPLHDMTADEPRFQENMDYMQELYAESEDWKAQIEPLSETDYQWIDESRQLLIQYYADRYAMDISESVNAIQVYSSASLPETIAGFSDGAGNVYISASEIERVPERMLHTLLHELVHAIGVDFYADASGLLSNGFYEGFTEALTLDILKSEGDSNSIEEYSAYDEVLPYSELFLQADPELAALLVESADFDIAARIDEKLGAGTGDILLKCEFLLALGPDTDAVMENCDLIVHAYMQSMNG